MQHKVWKATRENSDSAIVRFSGKYEFLSNFYQCRVCYCFELYPSVEHAFQALKTLDEGHRAEIRLASTANEARRLGKRAPLRPDWEDVKRDVMMSLLNAKFSQNHMLRDRLEDTGDCLLIEGNTWHDRHWGAVWSDALEAWEGENKLGLMLMEIRDR